MTKEERFKKRFDEEWAEYEDHLKPIEQFKDWIREYECLIWKHVLAFMSPASAAANAVLSYEEIFRNAECLDDQKLSDEVKAEIKQDIEEKISEIEERMQTPLEEIEKNLKKI